MKDGRDHDGLYERLMVEKCQPETMSMWRLSRSAIRGAFRRNFRKSSTSKDRASRCRSSMATVAMFRKRSARWTSLLLFPTKHREKRRPALIVLHVLQDSCITDIEPNIAVLGMCGARVDSEYYRPYTRFIQGTFECAHHLTKSLEG